MAPLSDRQRQIQGLLAKLGRAQLRGVSIPATRQMDHHIGRGPPEMLDQGLA